MMDRRTFVGLVLAGLAQFAPQRVAQAQAQSRSALQPSDGISGRWDDLVQLARERAGQDFALSETDPSGLFADLDYDAYRAIRPQSLQLGDDPEGMELDALPPGSVFRTNVRLTLIHDGAAFDLAFDPAIFDFGADQFDPEDVSRALAEETDPALGYSGFRLRDRLNRPDKMDEFAVFQGASYFRAVARGMNYGLSARGLAIGTAAPGGEEFPRFTHFWIEAPAPNAQSVTVRAFLDSRSCTGAYEFDISAGETTVMTTRLRLFPRREITQIGIAPLTSMYYFGPSRRAGVDDFRDAVHDSSGLQMVTGGGRRIWRSLSNPPSLQLSAFSDKNPKGFGLTQRQRTFEFYQDAEARYEKRPSAWIEPLDGWGSGSVILVEIPVDSEFHDNIVAFWRPEAPLVPSEDGHGFEYRIHWCAVPPDNAPLGRAHAFRSGISVNDPDRLSLVVDFRREDAWPEGLRIEALANGEQIGDATLVRLPDGRGLRAAFGHPVSDEVTEFELTLIGADGPESETWLYRMPPS